MLRVLRVAGLARRVDLVGELHSPVVHDPGRTLESAYATRWVVWFSLFTTTCHGFPSPLLSVPREIRSRGGVIVVRAMPGRYQGLRSS